MNPEKGVERYSRFPLVNDTSRKNPEKGVESPEVYKGRKKSVENPEKGVESPLTSVHPVTLISRNPEKGVER